MTMIKDKYLVDVVYCMVNIFRIWSRFSENKIAYNNNNMIQLEYTNE